MSAATIPYAADILIVDDTLDNLRLLSGLLVNQGYKVRKAMSGDRAISAAQVSPPDLILLDIMMPGMNGYEVCRRIKADEQIRHIPIIFLSARSDASDKVEAFTSGGVDYITKPFSVSEVIVRVENQLRISRLQQALQQEVRDRLAAQQQLESLNQDLEARVAERTAELEARHAELGRLQEQLQLALDKEQSLNTLMAQLLETISHEFSTPLSIINTAAQMLKLHRGRSTPEEDDRCFHMISSSVSRIGQTLQNALTLTTAESNAIQFCAEQTDLADLCRKVVSSWKLAPQDSHQLQFMQNETADSIAAVDVTLFRQMLTNLLQNAIRFSPQHSTIQTTLQVEPDQIILQVRDWGIGIPEAEQTEIFQQFYRASNANSVPGMPGVGLGLAVVERIVRLHQGMVSIESELGQGTTVTVRLPRN